MTRTPRPFIAISDHKYRCASSVTNFLLCLSCLVFLCGSLVVVPLAHAKPKAKASPPPKAAVSSEVFSDADLPLTSSLLAYQSILEGIKKSTKKHPAKVDDFAEEWKLMNHISHHPAIADLFMRIAKESLNLWPKNPIVGSDWNYYRAIALNQIFQNNDAIKALENLSIRDRYYSHGLYLRAIYHLEEGQVEAALSALRAVLMPETQGQKSIQQADFRRVLDQSHMALARIYYQKKNFSYAIAHYRSIGKDSPNFYRALFEQSWALFLEGYPPYALGSLYGVRSPFFDHAYNPEAPLLESIVYYWLCQYDQGRLALERFRKNYQYYSQSLAAYTDRLRFTPQQGFQLLEDYLSGVSSHALGIERRLLSNVAERHHLRLLRNHYAMSLDEDIKIKNRRRQGDNLPKGADAALHQYQEQMKQFIGAAFIAGLKQQEEQFKQLGEQADFLEIELMFGQKEQLLGQKLEASLSVQKQLKKYEAWAQREQSWAADKKHEYWWDELGFHMIPVQDQCNR